MSTTRIRFLICALMCLCVSSISCNRKSENVTASLPSVDTTSTVALKEKAMPQTKPTSPEEPHHGVEFYSVDHYDVARDPAADLAETIKRATKEKKRILIQVGGDWCGWCRSMSEFIETDTVLREMIGDNFVIMKVTYTSEQPNTAFLSQYPEIQGYPHLFVLDSDGKLLHSQNTEELEEGNGYSQEAYRKFLAEWQPKE